MAGIQKAPPLGRTMMLIGGDPAIGARLAEAGFRSAAPASLLVNAEPASDLASIVARCMAFVDAGEPGGEKLIVTLMPRAQAGLEHWQAAATSAAMLAFTRRAALAWGPRHVRINMIETAGQVPVQDVAASLLAMVALPCLTGQQWTLGTA